MINTGTVLSIEAAGYVCRLLMFSCCNMYIRNSCLLGDVHGIVQGLVHGLWSVLHVMVVSIPALPHTPSPVLPDGSHADSVY